MKSMFRYFFVSGLIILIVYDGFSVFEYFHVGVFHNKSCQLAESGDIQASSSRLLDIEKTRDSSDDNVGLADNNVEKLLRFFGQDLNRLSNSNSTPYNSLSVDKTPTFFADYGGANENWTYNDNIDLYQQNYKDTLHVLTGSFYAKILSTTNQVRDFESLIQVTMSDYGFDGMSLSDTNAGVSETGLSNKNSNNRTLSYDEIETELRLANDHPYSKTEYGDLKLFQIFKYFTVVNFFYGFLVIILIVIINRAFKFLARLR